MAARSTREQMIVVAERLFAERGVDAVSLREIGTAAGQRNTSAAQYHFGSKQGLVDAIFEFRMGRIDERRRAMLAALDAAGRGEERRGLLEAVVYPLAECIGHEDGVSWYARFLAQVALDPAFDLLAPPRDQVTRGLVAVTERLEAGLTLEPPELADQRLRVGLSLVVEALADHERRLAGGRATSPTPLLAANLLDMVDGLLSAPVSETTAREAGLSRRRSA